jgi:hypothetical protein
MVSFSTNNWKNLIVRGNAKKLTFTFFDTVTQENLTISFRQLRDVGKYNRAYKFIYKQDVPASLDMWMRFNETN